MLHFLSETELFGEKRIGLRKKSKGKNKGDPVNFEELKIRRNKILAKSNTTPRLKRGVVLLSELAHLLSAE